MRNAATARSMWPRLGGQSVQYNSAPQRTGTPRHSVIPAAGAAAPLPAASCICSRLCICTLTFRRSPLLPAILVSLLLQSQAVQERKGGRGRGGRHPAASAASCHRHMQTRSAAWVGIMGNERVSGCSAPTALQVGHGHAQCTLELHTLPLPLAGGALRRRASSCSVPISTRRASMPQRLRCICHHCITACVSRKLGLSFFCCLLLLFFGLATSESGFHLHRNRRWQVVSGTAGAIDTVPQLLRHNLLHYVLLSVAPCDDSSILFLCFLAFGTGPGGGVP